MDQCGRIRLILKENGLKQRQLAAGLGVTESYISKLLRDPGIRLSPSLAALVEERYSYRAQWLLTGQGPKLRQARGQQGELSELHQRALARLEKLDPWQLRAVLAFVDSLEEVGRCLEEGKE